MRRYLAYLNYLLWHKWYVILAGKKLGLPLLMLILHDWDKFLPDMLYCYANFFYNSDGSNRKKRDSNGYFNPFETGDKVFDYFRFRHLRLNKHHWQYWTMVEGENYSRCIEIPEIYLREMLADWVSAGKLYKSKGPVNWYNINKKDIILHPNSRESLEKLLCKYF